MKLIYLILFAQFLLLVCCSAPQQRNTVYLPHVDSIVNVITVEDFVNNLDSSKIGTKMRVKGRIIKVDRNNKRCMIANGNVSMRLDAKGDIVGFNRELIGCDVSVYGLLRERRYYLRELDSLRALVVNSDQSLVDSLCERQVADLDYIDIMRQWIKDTKRPYYSILSIDCEDYIML